MNNSGMVEFIMEHKKYDEVKAIKAAYQVRLFVRSLIYAILLAIILGFMGLLRECLILFVLLKLYRGSAGGIHVTGYVQCFVFSFLILTVTVVLSRLVHLNIYMESVLFMYIASIWYFFIPQGTSQRPVRKADEKKKMKLVMLILIVLTIALRFINVYIYSLALWALVITLTLTTPLAYRLFRVKHDRI